MTPLLRALTGSTLLLIGLVVGSCAGELYVRQNRAAEARREFETLAARQPRLVEAPTMLGLLWGMEGNMAEAERWFQRALREDTLGWAYYQKGLYSFAAAARRTLQKLLY